ncbi:hypothetical protein MMC13_008088 [Lambiella insularis]|nr:hypothetical protein [Lambiella insularis]
MHVAESIKATPTKVAQHEVWTLESSSWLRRRWSSLGKFPRWIIALYVFGTTCIWGGTAFIWLRHREEVPITGRNRFSWRSVLYIGEIKAERFVDRSHPGVQRVQRIFNDIVQAAGMEDLKWSLDVIPSGPSFYAAVTPTGNVFVGTGFLALAPTDNEVALVLGHEIAHILAKHSHESFNRGILEGGFLLPLTPLFLLGAGITMIGLLGVDQIALLGMLCFLPASPVVVSNLANSRTKESEADYIGMLLMAEAGYDPRIAPSFWEEIKTRDAEYVRQLKKKYGNRVKVGSEWESTHPHPDSRIKQVRAYIPKVLEVLDQGNNIDDDGLEVPTFNYLDVQRWRKFKQQIAERRSATVTGV